MIVLDGHVDNVLQYGAGTLVIEQDPASLSIIRGLHSRRLLEPLPGLLVAPIMPLTFTVSVVRLGDGAVWGGVVCCACTADRAEHQLGETLEARRR